MNPRIHFGKLIISKNNEAYATFHKLNIIKLNGNFNKLNVNHKIKKLSINGNNNNIFVSPSGKINQIILKGSSNQIICKSSQILNISDYGLNNKNFFEKKNNLKEDDDDSEIIDTLPQRFVLNWDNGEISSDDDDNTEENNNNIISDILNNINLLIESNIVSTNLMRQYLFNNSNKEKIMQKLIDISFKENKNNRDNEKCAICLQNFIENEYIKMTSCYHLFHFNCIEKWIEEKIESPDCPICRRKI